MVCTHCFVCVKYGDKCTKYSHICSKKTAWIEEGMKDIRPSEWKPGKAQS